MQETGIVSWSPGVSLENVEKQVIEKAFRFYRGNKTATANSLGIAIRTLDNKLEKYEADRILQTQKDDEIRAADQEFLKRARGQQQSINSSGEEQEKQRVSVGLGPNAGIHMEPNIEATSQHQVSLPKRAEVQEMLPKSHSEGRVRAIR